MDVKGAGGETVLWKIEGPGFQTLAGLFTKISGGSRGARRFFPLIQHQMGGGSVSAVEPALGVYLRALTARILLGT